MKRVSATDSRWVHFVVYYLLMGAVLNRMIPYYRYSPYQWKVIGLLVGFVLLTTIVPLVSRLRVAGIHPLFAIDLGIIVALLLVPASDSVPQDYYANLVLPLCGLAMWYLPQSWAIAWTIIFAAFSLVSMLLTYDAPEGLSFGLVYVAGTILVSVLTSAVIRSDQARVESQRLLVELQVANRRLQEYAQKVEALAAVEERNRLARELHDSVSQTIFSMTLTAQAARILLADANQRVAGLLEHLQVLSQNALAEMRTLIQELRPPSIIDDGLVAALRQHAAQRQAQDGLLVDIVVESDRSLPAAADATLFRVIQEALNNVAKHAQAESATVTLALDGDQISVTIEDQGVGFEPSKARAQTGHVGLSSMEERVRSLGGTLTIESEPGAGTRIRIEIDPVKIEASPSASPASSQVPQFVEE